MKLYQREDCPFSQKVRTRLTELGLSYMAVGVPRAAERRTELVRVSGQSKTPVLVDDGRVVVGSDSILGYLDEHAGLAPREAPPPGKPKTLHDRPSYAMTRQLVGCDVPAAREAVQTLLAKNGFAVLAAVDLAASLDGPVSAAHHGAYLLLVTAHPQLLSEALAVEPYAALLPPANVVVTADEGGAVVSASRPVAAWAAIDHPRVRELAERTEALLLKVITSL